MTTIINRYSNAIYAFCLRNVSSIEAAEDITQETFLHFMEHYHEPGKTIEHTSALLYQIAKNLIYDRNRKKKVRVNYRQSLCEPTIDLEDYLSDNLLFKTIRTAVEKESIILKPMERRVFDAIFSLTVNPKSNKEIALATGLNVVKVETAKRNLFETLRAFFRES